MNIKELLRILQLVSFILFVIVVFTVWVHWLGIRIEPYEEPHVVAPCAQEAYELNKKNGE